MVIYCPSPVIDFILYNSLYGVFYPSVADQFFFGSPFYSNEVQLQWGETAIWRPNFCVVAIFEPQGENQIRFSVLAELLDQAL